MSGILLVDDRPHNLLALEAILEPLGHPLVSVTSGEDALRRLLIEDFALILLDVQMPGLDGFETAELIKGRERTRHIPILFLTAISKDPTHVFRGYETGAVDYIFKPFDPEILRSKVAAFVELHEQREELARRDELLRREEVAELKAESEERYRSLADAMPQIVWTAGPDGVANYVNEGWVSYSGLNLEQTQNDGWLTVIHPDDLERTTVLWEDALASGELFETEYRIRRADGAYRWHLARSLPARAAAGEIAGWVGTCTDIDDRKRAEDAQTLLVEASAVLGSSLDYRRTLPEVAHLAVPRIADWCAVDMLEEDGSLRQLAVVHDDPEKVKFVLELQERYPLDVARVVRTGRPELVRESTDMTLGAEAHEELQLDLIRELGIRSWMCVPLTARGRTLGAITFVAAESGRRYEERDLRLAEDLARRAATAVDNAQLYREAEERAQAARVLASVGDGVFMIDREGVVRLWNPAAEAIAGLPVGSVLGQPAPEAIPGWEEVASRIPVASGPGHAPPRPETLPLEIDGRELWLSIAGVAIDDGVVYAFRDLTEERKVERMKTDFVATVSHELRTPLAAIYGSAMTVRRRDIELDEDVRLRLLDVIADESNRLAEIVNDLLLASHLDSGELQVSIERCDPRELADAVVEAARTHLPEAITLELKAPKDVPWVAADRGQLRQVLVNLVENAVKYSPDGGSVELGLVRNGQMLRFAVHDRGLGIPKGERTRIFEKFYRLDPNMTRGIGGTGLGLYICRELVHRVHGRIWVEARKGAGSTFFVEIPVAEPVPRAARSRRRRRSKAARASR
ncbi:MAG TPA: PAS domain S-box protein [Gaiellaceae bacterium]